MIEKPILDMNKKELKSHIIQLQDFIEHEQKLGKDIDTILDETDIFDEFEAILPDEEFPIFVITILNGFQSDAILDILLNTIENCKKGNR